MAKRNLLSLIFFITFLMLTTHVTAGVVYDEAINGDFSGNGYSEEPPGDTYISVGVLSNGSNTVLGTTFFEKIDPRNNQPFTWDRDNFRFSLPDTATISFQYNVLSLTQTNSAVGVDFRLWNGPFDSPVNPGFFTPLATGNTYFIAPITLAAGSYQMYAEAAGLGFGGSGRVDWSYSWDLTVEGLPVQAQVPEPTTLFLLIFGLISVGMSRKSRSVSHCRH